MNRKGKQPDRTYFEKKTVLRFRYMMGEILSSDKPRNNLKMNKV